MESFLVKSDRLYFNGKEVYSTGIISPLFYIESQTNSKIILNEEKLRKFVNHRGILYKHITTYQYEISLEEYHGKLYKYNLYPSKTFRIVLRDTVMNQIAVRDEQNYTFNFCLDEFLKHSKEL